jgi:hypothetical protein
VSGGPTPVVSGGRSVAGPRAVDLRRAPLETLRRIDFRADERDFWADEAALWDRFVASWAGLDDLAWTHPGAAPSDAGGPDWSLADHVAHVADWLEIALGYVDVATRTGRWPTDDEYDGGDFDRFNETRRELWATVTPAEIRQRLDASHAAVLAAVRALPLATIRGDEAWGWVFMVLHGHQLDHLGILEPWADVLRRRQIDGDPFGADPYGLLGGPGDTPAFFATDRAVFDALEATLAAVPDELWTSAELTPGWDLKDHAAHVTAWLEEGVTALDEWRASGKWRTYAENEDEWNTRAAERWRPVSVAEIRDRLSAAHEGVVARAQALPDDVLWSYDGIGWTYEVLHGHVRRHLAMVAPWAARVTWPAG